MHRSLKHLFVIAVLALPLGALKAQGPAEPPRVAEDLCACIGTIDPQAQDRSLGAAVRTCLEDAVVRHPSEVLSLLDRAPKEGTRAYQLGVVLGDVLQRDCPGFRIIQARLQQIPAAVPVGRRGT